MKLSRSSTGRGGRRLLFIRLRLGLPRYLKYTLANPKWTLMFFLARFDIARRLVRRFSPRLPQDRTPPKSVITMDSPIAEALDAIRQDGYAFGFRLPQERAKEVHEFARPYRSSTILANYIDPKRTIIKIDEFLDLAAACPTIRELESDPLMREIAAQYLGTKPVLLGTMLWWSLAKPASMEEQLKFAQALFHYDVHDYGSLKFSFYLTDVDQNAGPHTYVSGTHNHKKFMGQMTLLLGRSDRHIEKHYGADNIIEVYGLAGSGFAHDPFCYHKGRPPRRKDRLVLQFEFSRSRYVGRPYATAVPLKLKGAPDKINNPDESDSSNTTGTNH